MPFDKTEWRERMKQQRREQRRVAMANDPRVQAMKQALKEWRRAAYEKAKDRRKVIAAEQKQRQRERQTEQRAQRPAALMKTLRPATDDEA